VRLRTAALMVVLALVAAACGSRLSAEDRQVFANAGGGGTGSGAGTNDGIAIGEDSTGAGEGSTAGGTGAATAGSSGGTGAAASSSGAKPPAAPKSGNGGATDTGVTATEITIAVLTDRTGPVPGIFEPSVRATQAWANYINSKGGVYGRKIKVIPIDSKTSAADNRAGALQACQQAFAVVGSMSAYDDGGAAELQKCGIPDISATVVNPPRDECATCFPAFPNLRHYVLGSKKLLADENPGAEKTAAMLWLNASVARYNAQKNMTAASSIGYNFVYPKQVEVVEPNYTPYVTEMKDKNVQYVSMVGDNNSAARLLKAFKSQNYIPKVREFDTVIYDPKFLQTAGAAAEGVYTSITITPLEEAASNPEYSLYLSSLKRSSGGNPDGFFGAYAWSASRLFQEALEKTGPEAKRTKVLEFLKGLHSWNNHGMHAAHDIGNKTAANCFISLVVKGGKFTRHAPASGFDCNRTPMFPPA
jgi:ABC-type branched-subunit amino acid transport system substrate-binding protein